MIIKKKGGGAGREKKPGALLQKKKYRNYLSFFSLLNSHTSLKIKRVIFQWNKYIRVFSSTDFSIIIFVREATHPERQAALSPCHYLSLPMLVLPLCSLLNSTFPRRFGQKHAKQPHKQTTTKPREIPGLGLSLRPPTRGGWQKDGHTGPGRSPRCSPGQDFGPALSPIQNPRNPTSGSYADGSPQPFIL